MRKTESMRFLKGSGIKMSDKVVTRWNIEDDCINVSVNLELAKKTTELHKIVFDSKEKAIRLGLIKLGWTPPKNYE